MPTWADVAGNWGGTEVLEAMGPQLPPATFGFRAVDAAQGSDFEILVDPVDAAELAHLVDDLDEIAQILIGQHLSWLDQTWHGSAPSIKQSQQALHQGQDGRKRGRSLSSRGPRS